MSDLNEDDVRRMARLAQIGLNPEDLAVMKEKLQSTFEIMNNLHAVDTEGIEPMNNPFDAVMRFRNDVVTESDRRDTYQKLAKNAEQGLYLVPKVIE